MTTTSDSQCELRRQRREVGILLAVLALVFALICWRMPSLALAIAAWVGVSFTLAGLYAGLFTVSQWWHHRR